MQRKKLIEAKLPELINEAQQVYETDPVAAALMLSDGFVSFEKPEATPANPASWHRSIPSHGENVLRTAFWTLKVMGEDAQAGIAPTPTEWDMNISVAWSIMRMMEKANDPA